MTAIKLTRRAIVFAGLGLALAAVPDSFALAGPVNITSGGVAIEGYDPVAYFKAGKPVKGSPKIIAAHEGATYRFSSEANRDAFVAGPTGFVPQFGGFCAWAVSQGYTAKIDPAAWKVVDGKLYLNYSKSVQSRWAKDVPGNITKGNANWPGLKSKL